MNIAVRNPSVSDNVQTLISQDYASGTTLNVDSSTSFTSGNYILVGELGNERTEITNLTATPPSDTSLSVTSLKFSHPKGTPVYYLRWDKFELSYRTSDAGAWTVYPSMPGTLAYDALNTDYRDTAATDTYSWRYRYYSTEAAAYSNYSPTLASTGWPKNAVGYMVRNIRKIINDPASQTVSDTELTRFLNTAQDKIYALYDRWWFLFKRGTAIPTVVSQREYALPSDFGRMHSVLFNYVQDATDLTYNLKYITMVEMDYLSRDNNAQADDNLKNYALIPGDSTSPKGYLKVDPKPATAGLNLTPRYYKLFTDLVTFGDETECPIPSMLEDYALAEVYKIRKEEDKATYYDKLFREQVDLLKLEQRKQVGQPSSLWEYKGRHADSRLHGTRAVNGDTYKENYW